MDHRRHPFAMLLILLIICGSLKNVHGALPPEVRRELSDLKKEVSEVSSLIRKKQVDEARAILEKVETRLTELMIDEDERDRNFTGLRSALEKARESIPVSFESEIAPIIKASCVQCHGEQQSAANLRLDTYNNMGRGGRSGPLLIPRRPQNSLILARLTTDDAMARMPRGREKLKDTEIGLIARWIEQGAQFDGEDQDAMIGDSLVEKKPPIKVVMADGSETVSFTKDVAPWMINICLNCHSGANPRSGYSIETFEKLLTDGDTGSTVVPGDSRKSYIVDLVLRQDPLKMPAGQAQLKRSQAVALEKWIDEGAHFDGTDPKAPLRSLVPTDAELEVQRLAAMSSEEFSKRRETQAKDTWKRVSGSDEGKTVTTTNLLVHGNAEETRLLEIANWGEAQIKTLTEKYKLPAGEVPWRGRLIVYVGKDRFDYEEFNTVLMDRRTPREVSGHAQVTANFETAYVAMHDVGDEVTARDLNAQQLLNSLLGRAYISRDGSALPDWLVQGFGLMEAGIETGSAYAKGIPAEAAKTLSTVTDPAAVFNNGTFAPEEVGAVGFLMVRFLLAGRGVSDFQKFVGELKSSPNVGRAIQQAYGVNAAALGTAFLQNGVR
ncbi:MAG: hypothetical protein KDA85_16485 [Planctomycetaceae bacterium]|nr:hypothetical protein [Planctomycetaceae bacterium]